MKLSFKDFYGQYIILHDETGSGNVRMEVKTMPNLNDLAGEKEENCTLTTDISLDDDQLELLHGFLKAVLRNKELSA